MQLGPRTLWDLNLALVIITVAVVYISWTDYIGVFWAKALKDSLLAIYIIITFIVTGVRPPPPE